MISGTGSIVNPNPSGPSIALGTLILGNRAGSYGQYLFEGGTLNAAAEYIGYNNSNNLGNIYNIGYPGGPDVADFQQFDTLYPIYGASNTVGLLDVGTMAGSTGTYELSGDANATLDAGTEIIGDRGNATFTQAGSSVNGNARPIGLLDVGAVAGAFGNYTLGNGSDTPALNANVEIISDGGSGFISQYSGTNTISGSGSMANPNPANSVAIPFGTLIVGNQPSSQIGPVAPYQDYLLYGGSLIAANEYIGYGNNAANGDNAEFQQSDNAPSTNTVGLLDLGTLAGSAGTYELSGDANSALNANTEIVGDGGTGTFTQTGGVNTISQLFNPDGSVVTQTGPSGATLTTGSLYLGVQQGSTAVYTLNSGGSLTAAAEYVGYGNSLANNDSAEFNQYSNFVPNTSTNTVGLLDVGYGAGSVGTYTMSNGSDTPALNANVEIIGDAGTGTFTQLNGTNTISQIVNPDGSIATLATDSGATYITGNLYVGNQGSVTGSPVLQPAYNLNGGMLTAAAEYIGVGNNGGNGDIAAFTEYDYAAPAVNQVGLLDVGVNPGSNGRYNLTQNSSAALDANVEVIGDGGNGEFMQSGGTNTITPVSGPGSTITSGMETFTTGNLYLGAQSAVQADYYLYQGTLDVSQGTEYIGYGNSNGPEGYYSAYFNQNDNYSGAATNEVGLLDVAFGPSTGATYQLGGDANSTVSANEEIIGDAGYYSQFLQGGGVNNVATNLILGNQAGAYGYYQLSGGTLAVTGTTTIGNAGSGEMVIESGGMASSGSVVLAAGGSGADSYGDLELDTNGVLETGSVSNGGGVYGATINFNGGILRASGDSTDFISNFTPGTVTLESGGGTIDNNGHNITVNATLGGVGALTSTGSGTTILTAANPYSGGTTVNAGTLLVNGSLTGAGAVGASGSGTILGGSGSIAGPVTISNGAAIAPGSAVGTIGTLSLGAGLTMDSTSTFSVVVGSTSAGLLSVTGNADINGTLSITALNPTLGLYDLLSTTGGSVSGTFSSVTGLPSDYEVVYQSNQVDLQRMITLGGQANQTITAPANLGRVLAGTTLGDVTLGTLNNTAPANSNPLNVSLSSTGPGNGRITGLAASTGPIVISGTSATITGNVNVGTEVGVQSITIRNTDPSALPTTAINAGGSVDVVNQRTFSSPTVNLGRTLLNSYVNSLVPISTSGLHATTTDSTLEAYGGGNDANGLTLSGGAFVVNGTSATATNARYLTGSLTGPTAGSTFSGSFALNASDELAGTVSDASTVSYFGTAVNERQFTPYVTIDLGRTLLGAEVNSAAEITTSGLHATTTDSTLEASASGNDANGLTLKGGPDSITGVDASDTITRTLTGTLAGPTAGSTFNGLFVLNASDELAGTVTDASAVAYSGTAVNQRTFSSPTINLGRTLLNSYVNSLVPISTSGLHATTTDSTLEAYGGGNDANGLTLSGGAFVVNGTSATATNARYLTGSLTGPTAGSTFSGSFALNASDELAGTVSDASTVSYFGTAVNERQFTPYVTVNLGRTVLNGYVNSLAVIATSGLHATTTDSTLEAYGGGYDANGLTLSGSAQVINGTDSTDTLARFVTGALSGPVAGSTFNGLFVLNANDELAGTVTDAAAVAYSGTAVNQRTITDPTTTNFGVIHEGVAVSGVTNPFSSTGLYATTTSVQVAANGSNLYGITVTGSATDFDGSVATQSATRTFSGAFDTAGSLSGSVALGVTSLENLPTEGAYPDVNFVFTATVFSGKAQWISPTSGNWSPNANWTDTESDATEGAPGLSGVAGDTALFAGAISGPATVSLNGVDPDVAAVTFDNSTYSYTIAQGSGGTLTLDNGAGTASITDTAGDHTISAPVQLNSDTTVTVANSGDVLTVSGPVGGNAALTVGGSGTLVLGGNNGYSGGTTIDGSSTVQVASDANLGSGDITLAGGELLTTGVDYAFSTSKNITVNGSGTLAAANFTTATYNGQIEGEGLEGGGLFVGDGTNNGTVVLTGNNNYAGGTFIESGTLQVASDANLGTGGLVLGNGELLTTGNGFSTNKSVTLNGSGILTVINGTTATYNGLVSGNGGLQVGDGNVSTNEIGTVVLTNASNSYSGGTTVNLGVSLQVDADDELGSGPLTLHNDGQLITTGNSFSTNKQITLTGYGGGLSPIAGTKATYNGAIVGTGQLYIGGSGTVVLTNENNSYSGGTEIGSTLQVDSDAELGTGSLQLDGDLVTTGAGNSFVTSKPIALGFFGTLAAATGTTATYNGVISDGTTTPGLLFIGGNSTTAGTVVLTNTNTYSGGTFVDNNATVEVASDANLGSGGLTIAGAELLTTGAGDSFNTSKAIEVLNEGTIAAANGTTATYNGVIDGGQPGPYSAALTIGDGTNTGTVVLTNTNTYGGGTTVKSATLQVSSDSNLGTGNVTLNNGELLTTGTVASIFSTSKSIDLQGAKGILAAVDSTSAIYNGTIYGPGALQVGDGNNGDSVIVLTHTNTYMGGTTIENSATLQVASDTNLGNSTGNLTFDNGILVTTGAGFSTSRSVTLNGACTLAAATGTTATYVGAIVGGGLLSVGNGYTVDRGTVVLTNTNNTYSGGTDISYATLQVASDTNLGSGGLAFEGGELLTTASNFSTNKSVYLYNGGYFYNGGTLAAATGTTATYNGSITGFGQLVVGDGANNGTVVLTNANSYFFGTIINGGTLDLNATTGSLASGSDLSFGGTGLFNYDGTGIISGSNNHQTLGALAFNAGDGTVESTLGSAGSSALSFTSVTRATGATGDFVTTGGTSATNQIRVTGGQSGLLSPGLFFNGNSYASVTSGLVGAENYATDPNGYISNGSPIAGTTASSNVEVTSSITAQSSAAMNTLNLGANSVALADNATLDVNGILESGGTASISGGSAIDTAGSTDLVVRTNLSTDTLNIYTNITAADLTKSGAGTLNLDGSYNGNIYLDGGNLGLGSGVTVTGPLSITNGTVQVNGTVGGAVTVGAGGTLGGSGQINGKVIVASGGSTYPGDPQILTVNTGIEYQSGSTAEFSVQTNSGSSHPPTPGTDYDQIQITPNTASELQIDSGATLQLNLSAATLAYLQSNANPSDLYFVFNLGSGTSTGQFSDLTLLEGADTYYTEAIGANGMADFSQLGLDFNLSYTASEQNNSLLGGNDVAFSISDTQAVPEPSSSALLLGGLGLLAFWRARTRQTLN